MSRGGVNFPRPNDFFQGCLHFSSEYIVVFFPAYRVLNKTLNTIFCGIFIPWGVSMTRRYEWILAFFCMLFYACSDQIITECETESLLQPTDRFGFQDMQEQVFSPSCAISGCHRGQDAPFGLDLSAGKAYDHLVNVDSRLETGTKRVLPGNSAQSYLIRTLNGNNAPLMPPSGKLNQAVIDSVAAWIDRGAVAGAQPAVPFVADLE